MYVRWLEGHRLTCGILAAFRVRDLGRGYFILKRVILSFKVDVRASLPSGAPRGWSFLSRKPMTLVQPAQAPRGAVLKAGDLDMPLGHGCHVAVSPAKQAPLCRPDPPSDIPTHAPVPGRTP